MEVNGDKFKRREVLTKDSYTYICPHSEVCTLHKKCHVLTTVNKLEMPIVVKQLCPAMGKKSDGRKKEIEIVIGQSYKETE